MIVDFVGRSLKTGDVIAYSICSGYSGETKLVVGIITGFVEGEIKVDNELLPVLPERVVKV